MAVCPSVIIDSFDDISTLVLITGELFLKNTLFQTPLALLYTFSTEVHTPADLL